MIHHIIDFLGNEERHCGPSSSLHPIFSVFFAASGAKKCEGKPCAVLSVKY